MPGYRHDRHRRKSALRRAYRYTGRLTEAFGYLQGRAVVRHTAFCILCEEPHLSHATRLSLALCPACRQRVAVLDPGQDGYNQVVARLRSFWVSRNVESWLAALTIPSVPLQ